MSLSKHSIISQQNLTAPNSENNCVYEFEDFRLDAAHLMLYRDKQTVSLKPKVVETLVALVERRGEVISKAELMNRLWADSFVEESNLTQNIYLLRKTLGNCADGQPFIENFSRRGYRFNGEIKSPENAAELFLATHTKTQTVVEETTTEHKARRNWSLIGVIIVFCGGLILAGFTFLNFGNKRSSAAVASSQDAAFKRLTPDIFARYPTLSPDGKRLAYTQIENGKNTLLLKDIETGGEVQIQPPISGDEGYAPSHFSPDGTQIYYGTHRKNIPNMTIVRLTIASGETQEIARDATSPSAISPDGKQLAFINGQYNLMLANTDASGERVLLKQRENGKWFAAWGSQMSFSPDGTRLAACGGHKENGRNTDDLVEISVSDGSERIITTPPNWRETESVAWLADGNNLLVTARQTSAEPFQIWRVSYADGTATRITNDNHDYDSFSLSADSQIIAAEQKLGRFNIWTAPTSDTKNIKQLTFGSAANDGFSGIAFAPDGRIIYSSTRSGNVDLWMMNADGGNQKQLTSNAGSWNGRPQISPDGQTIVFGSSRTGVNQIWRMDADGGNPKQLTNEIYAAEFPNLSPDGNWIYYDTSDGESTSIWKIPTGGGEAIRVSTQKSAGVVSVSPDEKFIAYYHNEAGAANPWQIGLMSGTGGEPLKMLDIPANRALLRWTADGKSLIAMSYTASNLWEYPLDGGQPHQLTNYPTERISYYAVSPDYKQLAFSRGNDFSEAVLINLANRR
ncbi:MAG: DPP IV N-terminal domain-containing protein [Pyrinomonadaceae bacterium]